MQEVWDLGYDEIKKNKSPSGGGLRGKMDTYVECLVKAKQPGWAKFVRILLIMFTVVFAFFTIISGSLIMFILAIAMGVASYFVNQFTDLEYEYLYVDREIFVDKVMARTRRKRIASYQMDRIEICAPIRSYRLDNYKNRQVKVKDYSVGEELKPDLRYVLFYEGGEKLILNPSEELIKVMKNVAPRKVFSD